MSQGRDPSAAASGRHSRRSVAGCWTCRGKKVKCDEQQPFCARCSRLHLFCDYQPRQRKPYVRGRAKALTQQPQEESRLARDESGSESHEADAQPSEEETDNSSQVIVYNLGTSGLCHYSPSPPNVPAACSLTLGLQEREAIQYFRTTFSRHQHTKNPQYNVISVIYNIATKSELAMHMAVSVARREMLCLQNNGQADVKDDDISILHYSAALSQLAEFVNGADAVTGLDTILASIWLMLTYEQKFGDGNGVGLSSHLKGLATIVQSEARQALTLPADANHHIPSSANTMELDSSQRRMHTLSLFSARMLIWISLLDAGAASTGLGGDFNASLHGLLEEHAHICDGCDSRLQTSLFRSFTEVAKYSNPLFCRVWGDDYPIQELMDDISNHDIFLLYGSCFQVRYMASRLDSLRKQVSTAAEQCENVIELAFQEIAETYTETFLLASKITVETDNSLRVIKNLRFIVPHYHAAILYYVRCADPRRSSPDRRMVSLKMIMKLAYQAFKLEGDEAMLRIAWPLFIAILETDDLLHREWLIARLHALGKFGKNYSRAASFVLGIIFLIVVPDNQLKSRWLSETGRVLAVARVRVNQQGIGNKHFKTYQFKEALMDPLAWAFAFYSIASNIPNGGISNFFSQLIVSFGYSPTQSLLLGTPAGAVQVVSLLLSILGAILLVALPDSAKAGKLVGYYLTLAGTTPFVALLSLISSNIAGYTKKTTVAAMYLIFYCAGNIIGPQTFRPADAPGFIPAKVTILVCYVLCMIDVIFIWWYCRRMNQKKAALRAEPGYVTQENSDHCLINSIGVNLRIRLIEELDELRELRLGNLLTWADEIAIALSTGRLDITSYHRGCSDPRKISDNFSPT
ncbi:hypothetical protein M431DRAFT_530667 [Trichoderma harzianum CBS 226.95]|uniref:Zn(2)-C6 fungal-type domain-containing protein n=1 Tax=Trichoderma harzianum CBS 226.95 TaxID=983964 RepID=A0A2T4ABP1_TRIHA|nr:hypothetical protein M431DRAFT_530667 [Trichoderma harzianum CBS 226.95]PTB54487.1 hypothetical protein M431DRAFT_530667 [Trichoderma harzianum CBS 226.95]